MMLCSNCSEDYVPMPEEARLIRQGDLTPLCPKCAPVAPTPPPREKEEDAVEKIKVLWRAERITVDGKIGATMRLPKKIVRPVISPLRKPRADLLHVFVLTEGDHQSQSSAPRTILHTNLDTFIKNKQNFWVNKIPSYWDEQTGIARIEVKLSDILDVIREDELTRVRCVDGSEVRLHYR